MTRQEIIDYCLTFPSVFEDYPFDDIAEPGTWTLMRHKLNRKSFAMIYERGGNLCVNVKCDPFDAEVLRDLFDGITPGYHMNKEHWNTLIVGSDVPDDELLRHIQNSFNLTKPKIKIAR
ncbi:MAG: MmcQ/YjbR family DNA-binding protein [Propionibacteriaceae bacterium]|nr:MmcQ/YjbR family DNA-binding protein [Propionibacteriaceae bacterium]